MRNRISIVKASKYFLIFCVFAFAACGDKSNVEKEIEQIPISLDIKRFDLDFAAATPSDIPKLKKKYPMFFPEQFEDSVWVEMMSDTLQIELETEVKKRFPDNKELENILVPLFQHIKYYFPKFKTPGVVAVTSDVDYRNRVILADTLLAIGLDNYLGSEHRFYGGIDQYISKGMDGSRIGADVADLYATQAIALPKMGHFLDQMIYFGKQLYLKDLWMPSVKDYNKIGYTKEEFNWAKDNETDMWRFFIENEIFYKTEPALQNRFIDPAPFSKFYLEIDNESPGMVGRFLGWQIVRSYMKNNDTSVQELMQMQAEDIFVKSKYKPKK